MISVIKHGLDDFAIAGGPCVSQQPLHVNKPWAGDRDNFDRYLDTAWETRRFVPELQNTVRTPRREMRFLRIVHHRVRPGRIVAVRFWWDGS